VLPMNGDKKPVPFVYTPFNEGWGSFSPDGKWIAYSSNESGTNHVYVEPFPATGDKFQVSVEGGFTPFWRRDGREFFFISPDNRVMAASVEAGREFRAEVPRPLFQVPTLGPIQSAVRASVSRDGGRFLLVTTGTTTETPVTVLLNWMSALNK